MRHPGSAPNHLPYPQASAVDPAILARHPRVMEQYRAGLLQADNYLLGEHGLTTVDETGPNGNVIPADTTYLMKKLTSYGPADPSEYPDVPDAESMPENLAFTMQHPGLARLASALLSTDGNKQRAWAALREADRQRGFSSRQDLASFYIDENAKRWAAVDWWWARHHQRPITPGRVAHRGSRLGQWITKRVVSFVKPYDKTLG